MSLAAFTDGGLGLKLNEIDTQLIRDPLFGIVTNNNTLTLRPRYDNVRKAIQSSSSKSVEDILLQLGADRCHESSRQAEKIPRSTNYLSPQKKTGPKKKGETQPQPKFETQMLKNVVCSGDFLFKLPVSGFDAVLTNLVKLEDQFNDWATALNDVKCVLLEGFGSKYLVFEKFIQSHLKDNYVIVLNGFASENSNVKNVLMDLLKQLTIITSQNRARPKSGSGESTRQSRDVLVKSPIENIYSKILEESRRTLVNPTRVIICVHSADSPQFNKILPILFKLVHDSTSTSGVDLKLMLSLNRLGMSSTVIPGAIPRDWVKAFCDVHTGMDFRQEIFCKDALMTQSNVEVSGFQIYSSSSSISPFYISKDLLKDSSTRLGVEDSVTSLLSDSFIEQKRTNKTTKKMTKTKLDDDKIYILPVSDLSTTQLISESFLSCRTAEDSCPDDSDSLEDYEATNSYSNSRRELPHLQTFINAYKSTDQRNQGYFGSALEEISQGKKTQPFYLPPDYQKRIKELFDLKILKETKSDKVTLSVSKEFAIEALRKIRA